MTQFTLGMVLGSVLTGTLLGAGTFYDSKGQPNAPAGSVQQFDYFRQRQLFIDLNALRRQADSDRMRKLIDPCGR